MVRFSEDGGKVKENIKIIIYCKLILIEYLSAT